MEERSKDFKRVLSGHMLTVEQFLDLRDIWNSLKAADRCALLREEISNSDADNSDIKLSITIK